MITMSVMTKIFCWVRLRLRSSCVAQHTGQQWVVSSTTGRQLRKHSSQVTTTCSTSFRNVLLRVSLGRPLPRFPSVGTHVMTVLASRSRGRCMTCPAILILHSAVISCNLLLPTLCRISSSRSRYDTLLNVIVDSIGDGEMRWRRSGTQHWGVKLQQSADTVYHWSRTHSASRLWGNVSPNVLQSLQHNTNFQN